jgi:RNA polymerase sigma factor (sigma-70 family)
MELIMKDYRIIVKIKNNYMLKAMERSGIYTANALSRVSGVSPGTVGGFLNLKKSAYNKFGKIKKSVLQISKILKVLPEDLFPPQHLTDTLENNIAFAEANYAEIQRITAPQTTPFEQLSIKDDHDMIYNAISQLTKQEQDVVRRRFGLNNNDKCTLEEVSLNHNITRERVRQIERKSLIKLRNKLRKNRTELMQK